MTYAEKLAMDVLNIRDRHGSMEEIVERIQQAMQAQREACAAIAWESVAFMHQSDYDNAEDYAREIKQAILNAEVKP